MGKTYFKPVIHVLEVDSEEIIAQSLEERAYGQFMSIGEGYETGDGRYKNNNRGRNSIWSDDE